MSSRGKLLAVFVAGALLGAVSTVELIPAGKITSTAQNTGDGTGTGSDPGTRLPQGNGTATTGPKTGPVQGQQGQGGNNGGGTAPTTPTRPGARCDRTGNGGATDRGVTANEIKLATTVVESGIGSSFQAEMKFGMDATIAKINREGGVCGRLLKVKYVDDEWNATRGAQYLENFIKADKVFAIPVGASSEGLNRIIGNGVLDKTATPVVGTDGLEISQYETPGRAAQPWVWPVAVATAASARIMVHQAFTESVAANDKLKATDFGIVFDKNYHFGKEAAEAFNSEVRRLTGGSVSGYAKGSPVCKQHFCAVDSSKQSFSSEVATVYDTPGGNQKMPRFVALFLEPQTALTWMNDPNTPKASDERMKYGYAAAQPLFTKKFAVDCKRSCHQMRVWTGFKPGIEEYQNDPAIRQWVTDLNSVRPQADEFNQFTQGAYVGMKLFVDALRKVGPTLTRGNLKAALDGISLTSGLTLQKTITFTPATRFANTTMQTFAIQFPGEFSGWRSGPIAADPRPRAGIG